MTKVFDAFSYWRNSERWAIEARRWLWQTLAPDVEYTMIACVGDRTHRGNPLPDGPPEIPDGVERADACLDGNSDWARDEQQRDVIYSYLKGRATADDLVIVCDTDEIVDPRTIGQFAEYTKTYSFVRVAMYLWMVGTTWRNPESWNQGLIMRGDRLPPNISRVRRDMGHGFVSPVSGWHLSYYGSDEYVDQKLGAFAHSEADTEDMREALRRIRVDGASHMVRQPLEGPLADFLAQYDGQSLG